jgi:hypothetical protein
VRQIIKEPKMDVAKDLNRGAAAIRDVVFGPESDAKGLRQIYRLLESGALPAFKLGDVWHMRTSTYLAHLNRLEQKTVERGVQSGSMPP